jgi:hypothetical protein
MEQAHLAEELALVEIREDHLVAFLVLHHHLDRAADDVIKNVRQIPRMDHDRLRRNGANTAITEESVDCRNVAEGFDRLFHLSLPC